MRGKQKEKKRERAQIDGPVCVGEPVRELRRQTGGVVSGYSRPQKQLWQPLSSCAQQKQGWGHMCCKLNNKGLVTFFQLRCRKEEVSDGEYDLGLLSVYRGEI